MKELFDFFFTGNLFWKITLLLWGLLTSWFSSAQTSEIPEYNIINKEIHNEIVKMDSIFFNAYNTCDLKTQEKIYNDDIEFLHDKSGLSTSKKGILEATKRNICGNVIRKLVNNSIEVYPIHKYGAVEIGYHKFINKKENNAISNPSKFIIVWKKEQNTWTITKVISLH